jgi:putative heme-binding domain-containing protein
MNQRLFRFVLWSAFPLMLVSALLVYSQEPKASTRKAAHAASPSGKQLFTGTCAGCHGLDGKGTERAPNITTNPQVKRLSQKELTEIISGGVPGTGMPGFKSLGASAIRAVTAYVRSMQGDNRNAPLPGDPKRGEEIFFGKGECSNCHMAAGRGGFFAPELTTYGQTHPADKIRSAITDPATRETAKKMVIAIANNGERYQGMIRNEDNFSIQLQSLDGAFHLLSKVDLKSIQPDQSIMPADYASRLSEAQLNDLVSYLISLGEAAPKVNPRRYDDE